MRKGGFEPPRYCYRQPLKLVRLPVPPLPRGWVSACSFLTLRASPPALANPQYMRAIAPATTTRSSSFSAERGQFQVLESPQRCLETAEACSECLTVRRGGCRRARTLTGAHARVLNGHRNDHENRERNQDENCFRSIAVWRLHAPYEKSGAEVPTLSVSGRAVIPRDAAQFQTSSVPTRSTSHTRSAVFETGPCAA